MFIFSGVESECGHYGSLFGVFGATGSRIATIFLRGLQQPPGAIPQSPFFGKSLRPGEQEGSKNPGSRDVCGETGLGGNVTDKALTAVTEKLSSECAFSVILRVLSDILAGEVLWMSIYFGWDWKGKSKT